MCILKSVLLPLFFFFSTHALFIRKIYKYMLFVEPAKHTLGLVLTDQTGQC